MQSSLPVPKPLANRGPTLATLHEVEAILSAADEPLSLNEVARRMQAKAVPHRTVRTVVEEFKRLGLVTEGSKGVAWTLNLEPALWSTVGARLA